LGRVRCRRYRRCHGLQGRLEQRFAQYKAASLKCEAAFFSTTESRKYLFFVIPRTAVRGIHYFRALAEYLDSGWSLSRT